MVPSLNSWLHPLKSYSRCLTQRPSRTRHSWELQATPHAKPYIRHLNFLRRWNQHLNRKTCLSGPAHRLQAKSQSSLPNFPGYGLYLLRPRADSISSNPLELMMYGGDSWPASPLTATRCLTTQTREHPEIFAQGMDRSSMLLIASAKE